MMPVGMSTVRTGWGECHRRVGRVGVGWAGGEGWVGVAGVVLRAVLFGEWRGVCGARKGIGMGGEGGVAKVSWRRADRPARRG